MITIWLFIPTIGLGQTFAESLKTGKLLLDFRYRLENVDQASFNKDAWASTLRGRIGYSTTAYRGFVFLAEFENIVVLGQDLYNDTVNGNSQRPVVADPEDTELNRAQITYQPHSKNKITLGRQRIILDNGRFIGNVGWRQNEQTYDGLVWRGTWTKSVSAEGGYFQNVNRIFGENHPTRSDIRMDGLFFRGQYQPVSWAKLQILGTFFDFQNTPAASHRNLGLTVQGQFPPKTKPALIYSASHVSQRDYRDGSNAIHVAYLDLKLGGAWKQWQGAVHFEKLEGNGTYGFSTPLATGHAFNGWADQFLATPAEGLRDLFLSGVYKADHWQVMARLHRFEADLGRRDFGEEADLYLTYHWAEHHHVGFKFADYRADSHGVDTRKYWAHYRFNW